MQDEKEADRALRDSDRRMSQIINFLPDSTFAVDLDGRVIAWNRAIEDLTGAKAEEMLGKGNYEYSLPFYHTRRPILIDLILRPEEEIEKSYFVLCKEKDRLIAETNTLVSVNNRKLWLWGVASPIYDQAGNMVGAIESIRDITARRLMEEALRKSEAQTQEILDASIDRIHSVDKDLKILWANKTAAKELGTAPEELIGRTCYEFYVGRDTPCEGCPTLKANETGKIERAILCHDRLRGMEGQIWLDCFSVPLKNESGEIESFIQVNRDITEQMLAEKALQASEEKFRTIFAKSPIGIELYDSEDRLIDANRADLELFGIPGLEQMKGCTIFNHPNIPEHLKERLRNGQSVRFEEVHDFDQLKLLNLYQTIKSGKMDLDVLITPIVGKKENAFCGYLVHCQDISDRKQTEKHIHALNQRLIKAHENERQSLSRYLHDRLANDLSVVKLGCDTLFYNQPEVPCEIRRKVSEFSAILKESLRIVRDVSYELSPACLEQMGLVKALSRYCEDFSEKTGLSVDFFSGGIDALDFDFDTMINLYRVVQEGLNNIKKHAEAENINIRLTASFPKVILRIEDDGKGFDPEKRMAATVEEKRMGLQSMQERVRLLGGTFKIHSQPGAGTRIFIEVPSDKFAG
jgi:PAS domain S-box-containing protein